MPNRELQALDVAIYEAVVLRASCAAEARRARRIGDEHWQRGAQQRFRETSRTLAALAADRATLVAALMEVPA